ncbi:MAG: IS30 family transposase [Mycoplasma sp.]|nr:IS30 family transposase [Mycoplasma sp.]
MASQVKKKKQSNRSKALKAKIEKNKDNFIFKYPVYIRVKEFKTNIDVYFCHSYASWEKGGVENFNGLIRKIYPKGFDFSTISQDEIDNEIKKINEIYRETLRFHSAKERYNELSLINWVL